MDTETFLESRTLDSSKEEFMEDQARLNQEDFNKENINLSGEWTCPSCPFSIAIFEKEGAYFYALNDTQYYELNARSISDESSETYLVFKNMEWHDYPSDEFSARPEVEVQALLEGEHFIIQNYGIAMNAYTVFEGLEKYLYFEKNHLPIYTLVKLLHAH